MRRRGSGGTGQDGERRTGGGGIELVTVPTRQGLEAVDILRRGCGESVGPVLHDVGGDTLGFLVPPGTADGWDVPGSTCTRTDGRGVRLSSQGPSGSNQSDGLNALNELNALDGTGESNGRKGTDGSHWSDGPDRGVGPGADAADPGRTAWGAGEGCEAGEAGGPGDSEAAGGAVVAVDVMVRDVMALAGSSGSNWLLPPGEADPATDPAALRAALDEAARMIEAADNCR